MAARLMGIGQKVFLLSTPAYAPGTGFREAKIKLKTKMNPAGYYLIVVSFGLQQVAIKFDGDGAGSS
ncbi:MAG: hypothetical protein ACUVRL_06050 [Candidatus Saccharicenans sp.]